LKKKNKLTYHFWQLAYVWSVSATWPCLLHWWVEVITCALQHFSSQQKWNY